MGSPQNNGNNTGSTNFVIYDCDGGSDDAWGLLLLLKAEQEDRLHLLGVTICGSGNTDLQNAARNVYRILQAYDRDDVLIFLGAPDSLLSPPVDIDRSKLFHGLDGFGDVLTDDPTGFEIGTHTEREHAVVAINNFCKEHPHEVTIIGVGPLTNIALCYSMYGDEFANNLNGIYIMGGNYQGVGNFTRTAEFNFYADAEAARIVLEKSKCKITILPWEPCLSDRFSVSIEWRFNVFGELAAKESAVVEILNKVEHAQWAGSKFDIWNPCDAMLVAAFIFGNKIIQKCSMWHATVDHSGGITHGQVILDHLHQVDKYPKNVEIIESIDAEIFKTVIGWVVDLETIEKE